MASLRFTTDAPAALDADTLVFAIGGSGDDIALSGPAAALDAAAGGALLAALRAVRASAATGATSTLAPIAGIAAGRLIGIGLGDGEATDESLRRAAGAAVRATGAGRVIVALASTDSEADAVAEGSLLGAYQFDTYRSEGRPVASEIVVTGSAGTDARVLRATVLADGVQWTRDHVNTPAGDLSPADFAADASELAAAHGLEIEVIDEAALLAGGFGGILGVGAGSTKPPRLVRLAWRHPDATRTIAFVGKGITFDSGGLSIKPAKSMETMKCDMAGAAAVVSAIAAVARLNLPVNVTAWAPLAENMPSGTATRPGDVLRM